MSVFILLPCPLTRVLIACTYVYMLFLVSQVKANDLSAEKKSEFVVSVLGSGQVFG